MSEIALAWEQAKGITAPIVGSTKIKHLELAVNSMDVELTLDEVNYFDELYVPHPIIGAINQNPPEGTVVLDRKQSKEVSGKKTNFQAMKKAMNFIRSHHSFCIL